MIDKDALEVVFTFLKWDADTQIRCFPDTPQSAADPNFTFDADNPLVRVAKVIHDLNFPREGEPEEELNIRRGVNDLNAPASMQVVEFTLQSLHTLFDLMWRSNQDVLFTKEGLKEAFVWCLIRKAATEGSSVLSKDSEYQIEKVREFILNYDLTKRD